MIKNLVWAEKYRPATIDDVILPSSLRLTFEGFRAQGVVPPNLILSGPPGMGKTTVARALCNDLKYDVLEINASLDRNIDVLRNDILSFASSASLEGSRKCVILDEFDYANPQSLQPALRNVMETYSSNCSFIMTCNHLNKIIGALHSRTTIVDFSSITKEERKETLVLFIKRLMAILGKENVTVSNTKVVIELASKYFPDMRRTLNEMQSYCAKNNNVLDIGAIPVKATSDLTGLVKLLKAKNFKGLREWVSENSDIDFDQFVRDFYDQSPKFVEESSMYALIVHLGEYSYRKSFVVDPEIHLISMLVMVMQDVQFKSV